MSEKIIIVSPHPDDESLGAGGYLLKSKAAGNSIYWLNITNMKEEYGQSLEQIESRNKEIKKVAAAYGFDGYYDLQLKPSALDSYNLSDIIEKISNVFRKVEPTTVILPNQSDAHTDHQITFEAAFACTKVFRFPSIQKVLLMEIISETNVSGAGRGFDVNYLVNISEEFTEKVEILKMTGISPTA